RARPRDQRDSGMRTRPPQTGRGIFLLPAPGCPPRHQADAPPPTRTPTTTPSCHVPPLPPRVPEGSHLARRCRGDRLASRHPVHGGGRRRPEPAEPSAAELHHRRLYL